MDICELTYAATPPSFNEVGYTGSRWKLTKAKKEWQQVIEGLLMASGLPRGQPGFSSLTRVNASARMRFAKRRGRDIGNYVVLLDKVLGDALVNGRWLANDTPEFYTFAGLSFEPEPGPDRTTVVLEYERRLPEVARH